MILSINSHLRYPPIEIHPDQVITFNAIRYCTDICEVSYLRLINNLSILTEKGNVECLDFPVILLDVWSVINNCVIFKNLICREFKVSGNEEKFNEINKAIKLRNTNQHIDERLAEAFLNNNYPIYGALSWRKSIDNDAGFIISSFYSGTFTNKKEITNNISNTDDIEFDEFIQRIEFTGIIREGIKNNYTFREEKVSISKIISEMIWWISELDRGLDSLNQKVTFTTKHENDLLIQLKGIYIQSKDL